VTTGGGGDGVQLIDWVLWAYDHDPDIPYPASLVLGPFMNVNQQNTFIDRVNRLEKVSAVTFDANIEDLLEGAIGVVSMGGYNTFCELLSFDNPGLIVPRTVPRLEQHIRASRAQELGLCEMLMPEETYDAERMAKALHNLAYPRTLGRLVGHQHDDGTISQARRQQRPTFNRCEFVNDEYTCCICLKRLPKAFGNIHRSRNFG